MSKSSLRIRAYGEIDELNSMLGVIVVISEQMIGDKSIYEKLLRVQAELMVLGSDLATPLEVSAKGRPAFGGKVPRIRKTFVTRLEKEIDFWQKKLPELRSFILPGGKNAGSSLHMARAISRRSERAIVDLTENEKINQNDLLYINRLSDWLFVLARYVNKLDGIKEVLWRGRAKT